jgi:hypothetical protein
VNSTAHVLNAIADCLLVNIQSDVIHMSFEEPPWLFSESASPLGSALCTPRAPHGLSIQTVSYSTLACDSAPKGTKIGLADDLEKVV